MWNERRVNFRTLPGRCNSAFSQLHIELMTTDTLCSDVLSKILVERISFHEVVAAYFASRAELQDLHTLTFFFLNFFQSALGFTRKVIGRFEHRMI